MFAQICAPHQPDRLRLATQQTGLTAMSCATASQRCPPLLTATVVQNVLVLPAHISIVVACFVSLSTHTSTRIIYIFFFIRCTVAVRGQFSRLCTPLFPPTPVPDQSFVLPCHERISTACAMPHTCCYRCFHPHVSPALHDLHRLKSNASYPPSQVLQILISQT